MATNASKRRLGQDQLDDLVMLDQAKEDRIMSVLKNRYMNDLIYTNIGPVLIAINPFKTIPTLYTEARIREYRGKKYFEMPPHPYALTDEAYTNITTYHENQCVIICGESGSGKTETAKIILQYISSVTGKGTEVQRVKDRMLSSNPILEGFGNAKTINNNNSSRFGKYMVLHFDYAGDPVGGHVNNYLLEKSRVVSPALNERNFHVFYQLTNGATQEERAKFYIENPTYYRYLSFSKCFSVNGINDVKDWAEMCEAFATIGLTKDERSEIMRALSIVLWLGNIDFEERDDESSYPSDEKVIAIVAHLLEVAPEVVIQGLCIRTINAGGRSAEVFKKPCRREEAEFNRDTLAKAMYSRLFDYLVAKINESIQPPSFDGAMVGILDIFGFEIFEINSFEQLCINFVNERLQQIFIELTLKTEQEEYKSEGIPWNDIPYYNNKPVCDLIESRTGILALLDDTCATNKNEDAFVYNMSQTFAKNECISCGKTDFVVRHYAGDVRYDSANFTVKNKDTLFDDLVIILQNSRCSFVDYHGWRAIDTSASQKARPPTVSKVFKEQVKSLMSALMSCVPHYIRCIKPNHAKAPHNFDQAMIQRQVQYLGLLENVRVRRAGYAYRATFERFGHRYGVLCDELIAARGMDDKSRVLKLCSYLKWTEGQQYAMGKTKIFIREAAVLFNLEELLERKISAAVTVIQSAYRFYLQKRKFMELKACGYDGAKILGKDRRRCSITAEYRGDYLGIRSCQPVQQLLQANGAKEEVVFADRGSAVNVKEKKGLLGSLFSKKEHITESRLYLVSNKAVYAYTIVYDPANRTNANGTAVKLYFRVPFEQIKSYNLSPYVDGYIMLHFQESTGVKDCLIRISRKTEFLAAVLYSCEALNITPHIQKVTTDKVLINAKKMTYANIIWNKDEMVNADTDSIAKDKNNKQDIIISCPTGTPFAQTPEPYRPPKVDYASGGRIILRATRNIEGNGVDELTFKSGQVLYVIKDEEKGWYQCETDQGQVGWVPSNAVDRISGGPAAPSRSQGPPAARPNPHAAVGASAARPPTFNVAPGGPAVPPPAPMQQRPTPGANLRGPPPAFGAPSSSNPNAGGVKALTSNFGQMNVGQAPPPPVRRF